MLRVVTGEVMIGFLILLLKENISMYLSWLTAQLADVLTFIDGVR